MRYNATHKALPSWPIVPPPAAPGMSSVHHSLAWAHPHPATHPLAAASAGWCRLPLICSVLRPGVHAELTASPGTGCAVRNREGCSGGGGGRGGGRGSGGRSKGAVCASRDGQARVLAGAAKRAFSIDSWRESHIVLRGVFFAGPTRAAAAANVQPRAARAGPPGRRRRRRAQRARSVQSRAPCAPSEAAAAAGWAAIKRGVLTA